MERRNTKQRTKLLEIMQNTTSHPNADWIYTEMRKEFPNISLGTVYRNLAVLEDMKMVKKISTGNSFERYDANTKPHIHFICEECNEVIDVYGDDIKKYLDECLNNIPHQILNHSLICSGICQKCNKV